MSGGRRKHGRGKLIAPLALMILLAMAALLANSARKPETAREGHPELVPVGTFADRKNIYDRRLGELAVSLKLASVYARPLEMPEPELIGHELAMILGRDEKELLNVLKSERSFVWLGRRLEPEKSGKIAELNAKGIYLVDEEQRFYPRGESAAHVLGFLDNEQGLAGIEYYYEQLLQGGWGVERRLPLNLPPSLDPEKGLHLVLSLDMSIQTHLEEELTKLKRSTEAAAATALVIDPSGEILAMVSLPAFDPNLFWKYSTATHRNRVLSEPLIVDGLWNIFHLAAAVDANREIPEGAERMIWGGSSRPVNRERSSDPPHSDWFELPSGGYASPALARLAGLEPPADALDALIRRVEMGEVEIDLPRALENGWAASKQQAAEGREIRTTALQLLAGFNRLVNTGGTGQPHLLKGFLVDQEVSPHVYDQKPAVVGQAASEAIVKLLRGEVGGGEGGGMVETLSVHKPADPSVEGEGSPCRYQDVLLGFSAEPSPVTFLLTLDGACVDIHKPSVMRGAGKRLLEQLSGPGQAQLTVSAAGPGKRRTEEEVYRQWRKVHNQPGPANGKTIHPEERMPDLRGNGLRQALRILQPYGVQVKISGSGRVVGQKPKAGSSLKGIREIRLELRTENE